VEQVGLHLLQTGWIRLFWIGLHLLLIGFLTTAIGATSTNNMEGVLALVGLSCIFPVTRFRANRKFFWEFSGNSW
jgi:uncharacterized membrane protein